MKNKYITIFLLLFSIQGIAADTTSVITHNEVCIFTDPSQGVNAFTSWGVFPSADKPIRRVMMHVSLAYPKDRAIAHWDYLDHIFIRRTGGHSGDSLNLELGRLLTPYGSNFKEDWHFTWTIDVTDFASFLRDSVEIEYLHSGYEPPELGWDLTVNFEMLSGPPIVQFLSMQDMWVGTYQYGNPQNDIELHLDEKTISRQEEAELGRLRVLHTGHGMDDSTGCSEFCSRWREVWFDGQLADHRAMWKNCGDNPLYPQGGTWIFDRAYWCPGDLQVPDVIDMHLDKEVHTIDMNMQPLTARNLDQPRENIAAYFFQYSAPSEDFDVAIEEIRVPSKKANFIRYNPAGFHPQITIRNLGRKKLQSVVISYKTSGYKKAKYTWHGELAFWEKTTITLPGEIDAVEGLNVFEVSLSKPNGKKDAWKGDNVLTSEFYNISVLPSAFVVDFLTNNKPEENAVFIVNSGGDTLFSRGGKQLEAATHYQDTLKLPEGKYQLKLTDSQGDGLEFWFMPRSGYGRLRLKDIHGNIIHLFESDCGDGQQLSFSCVDDFVVDTAKFYLSVNIYPRMVEKHLKVYTSTNVPSNLKLRIMRDGVFVEQHEYTGIRDSVTGMDVEHLEKGRYVMEIYLNGEHKMNRRFNKR